MSLRPLLILVLLGGCGGPSGTPSRARTASPIARADAGAAQPAPSRRPGAARLRPVDAIRRVVIISVDGLRPDLILLGRAPRVRGLCRVGSFTFWAETAPEAYTLPCHVSMLTGAPSAKHGVTWNDYIEQSYPNVPTLFELAKSAGYSTALAAGKMKFVTFTKPNTLDHHYLPPDEPVSDALVASRACALLRAHRPEVLFVHLPGVNSAGHDHGWGSPEQLAAVERADEAIGSVLDALEELGLTGSTLVLVTSDHGGAGKDHKPDDPRSLFIPWIASGPRLRQGYDLTRQGDLKVRSFDTFATACAFLGIDPGEASVGRPVLEILEDRTPAPVQEASPVGHRRLPR